MTAYDVWQGMRTLVLEKTDPHQAVVAGTGMSFFRTKVLRRLVAGPCSASELAERLGSDAPYISLTVRDLEDRGFIVRTSDPEDRRRRIIELTPSGLAVAEHANRILDSPPAQFSRLSDGDLATLTRIVRTLLD